jgi:hypothetical protein
MKYKFRLNLSKLLVMVPNANSCYKFVVNNKCYSQTTSACSKVLYVIEKYFPLHMGKTLWSGVKICYPAEK